MWDGIEMLFKNIKEPFLVLLFLVVIGLFVMLKMLVGLLLSRDKYIEKLHECISDGLGSSNTTLAKLVTLIEGMVYGRGGK